MDNNTPVAPTDGQPAASVASTTNTNNDDPAPTPPANESAPANQPVEPTPEQMAKYLGTTVEGLEKFKKFSDNNGGFDKVFADRKKEITTPQSQQPAEQQQPSQPQPQAPAQLNPNSLNQDYVEGTIVKNYFKDLAEKPEYANIATQLKDGTVMEEASKRFGIQPIANGKINEGQIKQFCDMYSKTMPAAPVEAPMTNAPTAQSTGQTFEGPITSSKDALAIIQENNMMQQSGKGEHPRLKEASEYLSKGFAERHPVQHTAESWEARKQRMQK